MSGTNPLTEGEFAAHDAYLRSLARRLLAGSQAGVAEDAVHDTWLRFLRRPPSLDRPVRPWLTRVLRNRSLELRRTARRQGAPEPWTELASPSPPVDEHLARREAAEGLHAAVRALREPYRGTVELLFQEGLAPAAAASRLGVPEATVRSRLRRAMQLLREDLERRGGGRREDWLRSLAFLARPRRSVALRTVGLGLGLGAALAVVTGAFLWTRLALGTPARDAGRLVAAPSGLDAEANGLAAAESAATRTPLGSEEARLRVRLRRAFSGDPVAGVAAAASRAERELARAASGAEGELELALPAGEELVLRFGATATTDPLLVELSAGWAVHPLLEVELPAVCDVEGVVEWSAGSPAAGVLVQAIRGPFPFFLTGEPPEVLTEGRTRSDGSFRLARVPVDAALLALADGGRAFGLSGRPQGHRSEESPMWEEGMERGPEDLLDPTRPRRIRLAATDVLAVEVLGPDGAPVEGAELFLKGSAYTLRRARTDARGHARFSPLADQGLHALTVRAPGLAEWAHGTFQLDRDHARWSVRLEEERTIEGSVVGPRGEGLAGVVVRATMLESAPSPVGIEPIYELPRGIPLPREVSSDGSGRFVVAGLGSGRYLLEAFRDGVLLAGSTCRGGERGLVLGGDGPRPLLRFRGTVRDAESGREIPGALVALERSRGQLDQRVSSRVVRLTGSDFVFEVDEPGRWVLHAAAEGYAPFSSEPKDLGPGVHPLEPRLHRCRDVVLRLEDARGAPIGKGWVRVVGNSEATAAAADHSYAGAVEPIEAGVARLTDVPTALVEVQVFAPYSTRPFRFSVPAGEEAELSLAVEADCSTPRLAHPWAVLDARTGREQTTEELDPLELFAYDEGGTRVLEVMWSRPAPEQKPRDRGRVRVPVAEGETLSVREETPPSPWWWFGPGPLFSRDGAPCLPPLLLAPGRYRIHLSASGYEPLERWIELGEAPSPAAPLRLVVTPAEDG